MSSFGELLRQEKEAVARRWFEDALSTYADEAAAAFARQKDPFANPVGHSLREGTAAILDLLLDVLPDGGDADAEQLGRRLHPIVRIRAIQQFSASEAVGFVFAVKRAVRAVLGKATKESRMAAALAAFDERVDRVALVAFDVYTCCPEEVLLHRVNEAKRRYSWVVDKLAKHGYDPGLACSGSDAGGASEGDAACGGASNGASQPQPGPVRADLK